jgi:hypothetical protein
MMKNLLSIFLLSLLVFSCANGNDRDENKIDDLKEWEEIESSDEIRITGKELQCPCCDYYTLSSRGNYDICPICFWEDDGVDLDDLDSYSGPNHMTLKEGRENFKSFGACDLAMLKHVLPDEKRGLFKFQDRSIQ